MINHISLVEEEYARLIQVLTNNDRFRVVNCWDRDNHGKDQKCITIGESRQADDASSRKRVPVEDILTSKIDHCSDNCLDYIFQISLNSSNNENFKVSGTKVEKLHVELGSKGAYADEARGYTQLSDHYGLSATINLL